MRLDHLPGEVHLTYCTNIHAGESWSEIRANLGEHVPAIKARVSPCAPMGLGLRLSAIAADELSAPDTIATFRAFLDRHDLYVFTVNAFPYGSFHGQRVKEEVYQPDWLHTERLTYTNNVADILGALLPADVVGSISTVPGTFKPIADTPDVARTMAYNMAHHVAALVRIRREKNREIMLALEPEPCCFLETIDETIAFFNNYLHAPDTVALVAEAAGLDREAAKSALRRHLGICFDVCHGAVEFEEPGKAFTAFAQAGIRIAKIQLSSALRVPRVDARTEPMLRRIDDGVYLHQVVQRRDGILTRFVDLAPAIAAFKDEDGGREWRVHCHVPIFLKRAGAFYSTQATLREALACTRAQFVAPHLEVETYTWDVLPTELREGSRADAIARELEWVIKELQ